MNPPRRCKPQPHLSQSVHLPHLPWLTPKTKKPRRAPRARKTRKMYLHENYLWQFWPIIPTSQGSSFFFSVSPLDFLVEGLHPQGYILQHRRFPYSLLHTLSPPVYKTTFLLSYYDSIDWDSREYRIWFAKYIQTRHSILQANTSTNLDYDNTKVAWSIALLRALKV